MKNLFILLAFSLLFATANKVQAYNFGNENPYYRGGQYEVYIEGDSRAVNRSAYVQNKRSNVYRQMGDGRIVRENLLEKPSWYTVVPAPHGTVDVFYVEAGVRKHMRVRVDLWSRYGWDCRFHIPEQGQVRFGGKTWY